MIEPGDGFIHCLDRGRIDRTRPAQHDDGNAKRARRGDLAVSGAAAAVLRYDEFDGVRLHQRAVVRFGKRPARGDVSDVGKRQRRMHRIDAADEIAMLRRCRERREFVAAERDENAAAMLPEGTHCRASVADFGPAVALDSCPRRPAQCDEWHGGFARGGGGIFRNDVGIGVRRIDQRVDALRGQIISQTFRAAKAADADRHCMSDRRGRTPGKRERHVKFGARREFCRQLPRFGGAAENKDLGHGAP